MKKNITIFSLIVVSLLALSGCNFSNGLGEKKEPVSVEKPTASLAATTTIDALETTATSSDDVNGGEALASLVGEIEAVNDDWNIYRNKGLGFELKYPKNFEVGIIRKDSTNPYYHFSIGDDELKTFFNVVVHTTTEEYNINNYFDIPFNPAFDKDYTVNELRVLKFVRPCGLCFCGTEDDVKKRLAQKDEGVPGCGLPNIGYRFFGPGDKYLTLTFFKDIDSLTQQDNLEKTVVDSVRFLDK